MFEDDSQKIISEIEKRIKENLKVISLKVTGSSSHYTIRVVSPDFEGKNSVSRQRMVFSALGDLIMGANAPIHAIDFMETLTSE